MSAGIAKGFLDLTRTVNRDTDLRDKSLRFKLSRHLKAETHSEQKYLQHQNKQSID